jgi:hypothetical protein
MQTPGYLKTPGRLNCKNGEKRIFLTLSYVSEQYVELNKKEKAFFVKRPEDPEDEEKDKIRMMRCDPENIKKFIGFNNYIYY